MKKIILITSIGALALIIIIFVFIWAGRRASNQWASSVENINELSSKNNATALLESNEYQTQTNSQASVSVEIMPKQLGLKQGRNIFEVSLDTHSVDLDFNFTKIIVLKDDLGNLYPALEWTGGQSGHHLSGDIIFPAISEQAKSIELQMNDINGVDRIFEWTLK